MKYYLKSHFLAVLPQAPLYVDRDHEMLISVLAILKAGGSYVPIEPNYPSERIKYILNDTKCSLILTQSYLLEKIKEIKENFNFIILDSESYWGLDSQNLKLQNKSTNLAYVIYTSGSTGVPKGVLGTHQGCINRFFWMWKTFPFTKNDICCQKTSLGFVDSIWEIFGALLKSMCLIVVPSVDLKDPHKLIYMLCKYDITRLVIVPSLLQTILDDYKLQQKLINRSTLLSISGEDLSSIVLQKYFNKSSKNSALNLYGSTEVFGDVTYLKISKETQSSIIGKPIFNLKCYVLDKNLTPLPIGTVGELYIGGEGLSRGYLNNPSLKQLENSFQIHFKQQRK